MDRYDQIQAAEDLGGIEMFPDRTPDLRKKDAPGTGCNRPGGDVNDPNHYEKE